VGEGSCGNLCLRFTYAHRDLALLLSSLCERPRGFVAREGEREREKMVQCAIVNSHLAIYCSSNFTLNHFFWSQKGFILAKFK
jgi:hypothetical protein